MFCALARNWLQITKYVFCALHSNLLSVRDSDSQFLFLIGKQKHRSVIQFLTQTKQFACSERTISFCYIVLSVGIEPTSQLPQSRILSIELREELIPLRIFVFKTKINGYARSH